MNVNETLELVKQALANSSPEILAKAFTQSASATSGLTAYDLEAPAKSLFPVLTPLRNKLPRVGGGTGIQANWRAITGINTANLTAGVSEGNRGGVVTTSTADYLAAFKGIGLEDYVTYEADYASQGFQDLKATSTQNLLRALMIQEEVTILGGNGTLALGTTPTPSLSDVTTGGALLANTTYNVICVALTQRGFAVASLAAGVTQKVTRGNADGSSDIVNMGVAQKSASATQATANDASNTHNIAASVAAVKGAFAYAWYCGIGAGTERLVQITNINSAKISALNAGGQLATVLAAEDDSADTLVFDGFLTQICKSGSNSYFKALATGTAGTGTPLTADTSGSISEIDTALQSFWDNYRLSPTAMWVSSQEQNYMRKKVLTGGTAAAQRFVFTADQTGLKGGVMLRGYTNPFTMGEAEYIPIKLHPNMPAGTIMFETEQIPYPLSNVTNVNQIKVRQEYYQVEWPRRSRKYEYGVYADEVLQCYFPPSLGMITNIAPG